MPLGSFFNQQNQRSSGPGMAARLSGSKFAVPGNGPFDQRQFMQANPGFGNPYTANRAYGPAIAQQAGDYDEIMEGYRGMMGGADPYGDVISKYKNETGPGKEAAYTQAPEWAGAYGKATEYANTGGISEEEKGDLRARSVSPIRAMYSNMKREMDRRAAISGGQSANYNASAARMAREGSEQLAGMSTNANAAIAEMQQKGRLSALPTMTGMAAGKNELMNQMAMSNANNRAQNLSGYTTALNAQANRQRGALEGMTSLYGTTPGLVNTFGNQMNQQAQTNNSAALGAMQNRTNRGAAAGNVFSRLFGGG